MIYRIIDFAYWNVNHIRIYTIINMGYMGHMQQLVKCIVHMIQLGIQIVATEKYHGTSTHIYQNHTETPKFHSGGEMTDPFKALFNEEFLREQLDLLMAKNSWKSITVYGEAYGGPRLFPKQMANTYGTDKTKFIVFDIKVTTDLSKPHFLDFYEAEKIAKTLGLDFVHYQVCPHEITMDNKDVIIEWLEEQTNQPSTCSNNTAKNPREGIVVRPITESLIGKKQERAICKNLNADFKETKSPNQIKKVNMKEKSLVFSQYDEIAETWVTENRGRHVLDSIRSNRDKKTISLKDIRLFLDKIIEDVKAESEGEIEWPTDIKEEKELCRALGREGSFIFKTLYEEFNMGGI